MIRYSLQLAATNLRRNLVFSLLTCGAVAIGIGGAMSVYTVYHTMSGDPIPWKSAMLFTPQVDNWGPYNRKPDGEPSDQLSYRDAIGLLQSPRPFKQAAMYRTRGIATPEGNQPAIVLSIRATNRDFFSLFDTEFLRGAAWSPDEEVSRSNVAVVSSALALRLFDTHDPIGQTINFDEHSYRVVGVLKDWNPAPRFYELGPNTMARSEDVYLPITTAIDRNMAPAGQVSCKHPPAPDEGWQGFLNSDCTWLQHWVELNDAEDVAIYSSWLHNFAEEQQRLGRFDWPPYTRLRNVREWLEYKRIVPGDLKAITILSFGFLVVCLVNAVSLLLAKFTARMHEFAVRRALGASRLHLFLQCISEVVLLGAIGAVAGLILTFAGVALERAIMPADLAKATRVDAAIVSMTLMLAVAATIAAGIFPAWHTSRQQPAERLKAP